MNVMLIVIILIIIILYFVITKVSSFSATITQSYPSPLPGPVLGSSLGWTSINDIPADDTVLRYDSTNVTGITIKCYDTNPDTTLNTISSPIDRVLPNQYDQTIVNYYLSYDSYACPFMDNSETVMVPKTIIDISQYNVGTSTVLLATRKPYLVNSKTTDYYYLSWNTAKNLTSVSLVTGASSSAKVDADTIKKIKASVLYSLINLYYNPGSSEYSGLVYDFSTNYPPDVTTGNVNTPNASTMGIKFTRAAKHGTWLYLLARAQWINNAIQGL